MSALEIPRFGELLSPFISQVPDGTRPRFLALLELFKQGFVELEQAERFGDIDIVWVGDDESVSVGSLPIDDYEG